MIIYAHCTGITFLHWVAYAGIGQKLNFEVQDSYLPNTTWSINMLTVAAIIFLREFVVTDMRVF